MRLIAYSRHEYTFTQWNCHAKNGRVPKTVQYYIMTSDGQLYCYELPEVKYCICVSMIVQICVCVLRLWLIRGQIIGRQPTNTAPGS